MIYKQVYHSPINNSTSKQLYSFGTSPRFEKTVISPCKKSYYDDPRSAIHPRSTSFGYGNKLSFQNREAVPPPGKYELQTEFTSNIIKKRGNSFGLDTRKGPVDEKYTSRLPAPNSYREVPDHFTKLSFTMRSKYDDPLTKHGNPLGPGQYPIASGITRDGFYYDSKYQSSKARKLSKSKRFQDEKVEAPGPGKYYAQQTGNMNKTGTYFCSKFRTTNAGVFGRGEQRGTDNLGKESPGPGVYTTFSEFALKNKSTLN